MKSLLLPQCWAQQPTTSLISLHCNRTDEKYTIDASLEGGRMGKVSSRMSLVSNPTFPPISILSTKLGSETCTKFDPLHLNATDQKIPGVHLGNVEEWWNWAGCHTFAGQHFPPSVLHPEPDASLMSVHALQQNCWKMYQGCNFDRWIWAKREQAVTVIQDNINLHIIGLIKMYFRRSGAETWERNRSPPSHSGAGTVSPKDYQMFNLWSSNNHN